MKKALRKQVVSGVANRKYKMHGSLFYEQRAKSVKLTLARSAFSLSINNIRWLVIEEKCKKKKFIKSCSFWS